MNLQELKQAAPEEMQELATSEPCDCKSCIERKVEFVDTLIDKVVAAVEESVSDSLHQDDYGNVSEAFRNFKGT